MEDVIYKGHTIKIEQDENTESPREWDNLGTMVCFHRNYELGDKTNYTPEDFENIAEVKKKFAIVLPLYLYDHSGLRMKVGSFAGLLPQGHAEFDTMQVGFIVVTADKLRKEYAVKRITKSILAKAEKILRSEVATYDQFLSGDVWGFVTDNDSVWGFYGVEDAITGGKEAIDYQVAEEEKKREAKTKQYIKGNVPIVYRQ